MSDGLDTARARDAIRDLVAAYSHGADRGRFDEVGRLFAVQGVLEIDDGRRLAGREAIVAFLRGAAESLGAGAEHPHLVRHHVSTHRIAVDAPHAAHGWAYFQVLTDRGLDHWGRYRDAYVFTDGAWLFASRHVRVDGRTPDARATIPR